MNQFYIFGLILLATLSAL